jgi:hypothetical protein
MPRRVRWRRPAGWRWAKTRWSTGAIRAVSVAESQTRVLTSDSPGSQLPPEM